MTHPKSPATPPRPYIGPLTDNRRWSQVTARADDIYVVTPPKNGTTWMQTIVALLLSGDPDVETDLVTKMPWVDVRTREMEDVALRLDAMAHRRSLKTHTPLDGLPYLPDQAHYICVFRHPLDAHFSFRKHVRNIPMKWFDLFYPTDDDDRTFKRFLDGAGEGFDMDAMPLAHILRHYRAALARMGQPNVTLVHYADMTRDLAGVFDLIAARIGVTHPPELMDRMVRVAHFDHMKANAGRYAPLAGTGIMASDDNFFDSGTSGKWHGVLTDAQIAAYGQMMNAQLTQAERRWLEFGDGK